MSLATEINIALVGVPGSAAYNELQKRANFEINGLDPRWFEKLVGRIATVRGIEIDVARTLVQKVVSRSDAIRYTQLGNPETIVLSDQSVLDRIMLARAKISE